MDEKNDGYEHPIVISTPEAYLNIWLSDEQLKEVSRQVAEILKGPK